MTLVEKIKLLFAARKPVTELVGEAKQIKSGWKTPAFWLAVLGTLGSLAAVIVGYIPATTGAIITTVLAGLYNIVRAYQNAQVPGVTPPIQSTRFWTGVLAEVSTALIALQAHGVNPAWFATALTVIAAITAAAQSVGANQPAQPQDQSKAA